MCDIVRRYSKAVEAYSIDECFADITGEDTRLALSYEEIAAHIKHDLEQELNMTFSVGLGPNKLIAKVASKVNKPSGLAVIYPDHIDTFLSEMPISKLWGIGGRMTLWMLRHGIKTALEFKYKSREWCEEHLAKPYREMWEELQGNCVGKIHTHHDLPKSIQCTRMFKPPSHSRHMLLSQLSKNIQEALRRARADNLRAKEFYFYIKTQEFTYHGLTFVLASNLETPEEFLKIIDDNLNRLYTPGSLYRATGVVLKGLKPRTIEPFDLFGDSVKREGREALYATIDALGKKYKKPIIWIASSLLAKKRGILRKPENIVDEQRKIRKAERSVDNLRIPCVGIVT